MGSGIALHLAGSGFEVLLLDLKSEGMPNKIATESLQKSIAAKPSNIHHKSFISRISLGNFDDDMSKIKDCDWVIEVIIERLDLKQQLYAKVEQYRKKGSLISSNTSGIPIHFLIEGRSEDFRKNFCGTHFFNPPRYLKLLELIPTAETDPEVIQFFQEFGKNYLGKQKYFN